MAAIKRKPFQGIGNIIRFNWHFYLLSVFAITSLLLLVRYLNNFWSGVAVAFAVLSFFQMMISLMVSVYVYDLSNLYGFTWLDGFSLPQKAAIVNIHAGFDETSALLAANFPEASLTVLDFYDPKNHTEVSIKRARKSQPAYPCTIGVNTSTLPIPTASIDVVFCLLAAHEIRNTQERKQFFCELKRSLKPGGRIVFIEHLRDISNFVAYTIGFLHFYSKKTWENLFKETGFIINKEFTITPFITGYILRGIL